MQFGDSGDDYGVDCAIDDQDGSFYTAGMTDSAIFGLAGNSLDIYVRKYFRNLTIAWTFTFESAGADRLTKIDLGDISRELYILGTVFGDTGMFNHSSTSPHNFVMRLRRETGAIRWISTFENVTSGENDSYDYPGNIVSVENLDIVFAAGSIIGATNGSVLNGNTLDKYTERKAGNFLVSWTGGLYRVNGSGSVQQLAQVPNVDMFYGGASADPESDSLFIAGDEDSDHLENIGISPTNGAVDIVVRKYNYSAHAVSRPVSWTNALFALDLAIFASVPMECRWKWFNLILSMQSKRISCLVTKLKVILTRSQLLVVRY